MERKLNLKKFYIEDLIKLEIFFRKKFTDNIGDKDLRVKYWNIAEEILAEIIDRLEN